MTRSASRAVMPPTLGSRAESIHHGLGTYEWLESDILTPTFDALVDHDAAATPVVDVLRCDAALAMQRMAAHLRLCPQWGERTGWRVGLHCGCHSVCCDL